MTKIDLTRPLEVKSDESNRLAWDGKPYLSQAQTTWG